MAPPIRTPRDAWIDEGMRALAAGGPDAVRVEALAAALGVTKGGFYGRFADRRALLDALLDAWEHTVVDDVIATVDGESDDPEARLGHLFSLASGIDRRLLATELAIRDWARRDAAVAKRLRRVDTRRMAYMRALFAPVCADEAEVEARCLLALSLFVGSHFIAVDHSARKRAETLERAVRYLASTSGPARATNAR